MRRNVRNHRQIPDAAILREGKELVEFAEQRFPFDEPGVALRGTVDLAVDAIEIANLVRVQIDSDGKSLRSATEDRVYKAIVREAAGVIGDRWSGGHAGPPYRGRGKGPRYILFGYAVSATPDSR